MNLNRFVFSFVLLLSTISSVDAQEINQLIGVGGPKFDPVQWSGSIEKLSEEEYILHYQAAIEKDWYIYSQHSEAAMPFRISFQNESNDYKRIGEATESETKRVFDDIFEEYVTKFLGYNPSLAQKISVVDKDFKYIKSEISYQVCKEVCIQQEFFFVHDINRGITQVFKADEFEAFEAYGGVAKNESNTLNNGYQLSKNNDNKSLWIVFLLSFLVGLAALLTPCIFPMIPLTVSFFTKQSTSRATGIRNAIFYGLSIIFIYVVLGLAVTAIFGATVLVELSTSVVFNLVFFILLIVFAISFFGAFEITLPQSWGNKMDQRASKGGLLGIFFMAMALAIVSFSCTGPIAGAALVQSATEGGIAPIISMLGFSSAIALPFALFALFPSWLNSLPKSGGWLNTVKVVLGFIELALAFKFLSNADLVVQGHYLERELFLAIIIAIMTGLAIYLFGGLRLPHDGISEPRSVGRMLLGLTTTVLVLYMMPGLWGAPLKLISGFPPPLNYSESPRGIGSNAGNTAANDSHLPQGAEYGPHNIVSFTEYQDGLAYAKKVNKPILIDFTGFACTNCRRMEELVWSDPEILEILKNDIVLISLYGDSREELPKAEQHISESGRRIRTVGNKWSDFQITRYSIIAAPYYVLINHQEENLNQPIDYTPDIQAYKAWLAEGINNF